MLVSKPELVQGIYWIKYRRKTYLYVGDKLIAWGYEIYDSSF